MIIRAVAMLTFRSGRIVFTGSNNSEILWSMMSLLGPFSERLLRGSHAVDTYFRRNESGFVYSKLDATKVPLIS